MQQGGGSQNMMSGLPPDILNKVLKDVTKTMSGLIQQDVVNGYQGLIQSGVPIADTVGHILGQLSKLSPVQNGIESGMSLLGGGQQPPQMGMNDPNRKPQPPQSPTEKSEDKNASFTQATTENLGPMLAGSTPSSPQAPQAQPLGQSSMYNPSGPSLEATRGFFDAGGFNPETNTVRMPGAFNNSWGMNRIAAQQKIMGKEPIQPSEQLTQDTELAKTAYTSRASYAKEERDRQSKFFENINQPLSSAKELSLVESALTGIDDITNILGVQADQNGKVTVKNAGLLKDMNFLKKNTQQLKRARDLYINKTLRRDSGAAIGKKEENDFKEIVGFEIGMKAFMQNPEVIAKSMLESKDQLVRDRNRLSPNEKQRSLVSGLRSRGFKDPEIYDYLSRNGEV